ncbi:MAG: ABC transporter permease [Muribaculaceae bacterium]|nr:ABC transporter permease [Muribaculaceae bacterium]
MRSDLTAAIAWRYLISKKTHGAVATISTVSVCAMAVATAAIVCVLSVFNGFRQVIASRLDTLSPDIMVTASEGKVFSGADSLAAAVSDVQGIALATPTLSDNALVICNSQEMPVTVKGVTAAPYAKVTAVRDLIAEGYGDYLDSGRHDGDMTAVPAVVSIGVAARLGIRPGDGMLLFAPRRKGRVNLANPASSFMTDSLSAAGIYRSDQAQFDDDGIILPITTVRRLLQYDDQASAIEIRLSPGAMAEDVAERLRQRLGTGFIIRDRMRQQEMNFRMISIEKWVSFMLLGFILVIAGFNIISSLSMLVLEKEKALSTFTALGLTRRRIGRIFAWESIYVSAAGGVAGIFLGLVLCLIQQHFGIITIGGDPDAAIVPAYPVEVRISDLFATLLPVAAIGLATAFATAAFARSRISRSAECQ